MPKATNKNLILYADDDPDDLELVTDALRNYSDSIQVLTFRNGALALSYLNTLSFGERLPCLIILDINMPIVNGKEALKQIRQNEQYAEVPVVLFTTSLDPGNTDFAVRYRAGLINKPIEFQQMNYIADQFISHCAETVKQEFKK